METTPYKPRSPRQLGFSRTGHQSYFGIHHSGRPLVARFEGTGWTVRVKDPESEYAEAGGWVTLAAGLTTLRECSGYVRKVGGV